MKKKCNFTNSTLEKMYQDFEVWHEVKLLINKLNGENKDQN